MTDSKAMLRIGDIEMAISQAKQDAKTYGTWMQVWYDANNDCYIEIRDDAIDERKHNGQWVLVFEIDKHGTETVY